MREIKMTDEYEDELERMNQIAFDREMEDTFHQIILACGVRPLKEKVSILYLTIDYIFANNKELIPLFTDEVSVH
jgi:hypothetical protein